METPFTTGVFGHFIVHEVTKGDVQKLGKVQNNVTKHPSNAQLSRNDFVNIEIALPLLFREWGPNLLRLPTSGTVHINVVPRGRDELDLRVVGEHAVGVVKNASGIDTLTIDCKLHG